MSILDDARVLLKIQPLEEQDGAWVCRVCGEEIGWYPGFQGHEPDCEWLSMPKVVAALEAADSLVLAWGKHIQGANSGSDAAADAVNAAFMRLRSALED